MRAAARRDRFGGRGPHARPSPGFPFSIDVVDISDRGRQHPRSEWRSRVGVGAGAREWIVEGGSLFH